MSVIKRFLLRTKKYVSQKNKNLRINLNIRNFQTQYADKANSPREREYHPEVLIPCYNHGQYLKTALESVPLDIPITIINDASTDNTQAIAEALRSQFKFKLIKNETNLNQVGSLNRAISESPNNLFIVLNADDVLLKYCVPTLLNLFKLNPDIRMAGGSCIPFSNETVLAYNNVVHSQLCYDPAPRIYGPYDARGYNMQNDINMTMSSCAFLKSAWVAVDGFWEYDRRICTYDDRDFQMRVSALFNVAVIEEPLALYRTISSLGRAQAL